MLKRFIAILLLIFISANMLFATTYYVSTTGNDAANGSSGSPWLTVGKSIGKLVAGDTLIVTAGTYPDSNGGSYYSFNNTGTTSNPITIIGQNAIIDIQSQTGSATPLYAWGSGGSYIIIDGLKFTTTKSGGLNGSGVVYLGPGSSHSFLRNLEVYNLAGYAPNSGDDCILFQNNGTFNTFSNIFIHDIKDSDIFRIWGHDVLITSCTISNFTNPNYANTTIHADCFQSFNDNNPSGYSYNIVIEKSLFINIPSSQIGNLTRDSAAGPFGWTFRNNVFKNCAKNLNAGIPNLYFFNNTFDGCGSLNEATIIYTTSGAWDSTGALFVNNAMTNSYGLSGPVTSFNNNTSASGFVNPSANNYNLTATSPLVGAGTNLSAYFTTDKNGNPRPGSGTWDIGAFEYGSLSTNPVISLSPTSLTFGSILTNTTSDLTFTVQNTGSGTLAGTATVSTPFSIVSGGSYSLGANQSQTVTVRFSPKVAGSVTNTVTFTGAGGKVASVSGTGVNPSTTFQATSGLITAPFVVTSGLAGTSYISQSVETGVANGGKAVYTFTITNAGSYVIQVLVNAASDSANSVYLNIDAQPQDPTMIWDIPITTGFEQRQVSWRGNGTSDNNQFVPQIFNLAVGTHQLIVVGREANVQLQNFMISPTLPTPQNLRIISP
jgi:hypothetical protein